MRLCLIDPRWEEVENRSEITRIVTEVALELCSATITDQAKLCIVYKEAHTVPPENLEVSERKRIILLAQFSPPMLISLTTLLATLCSLFRSRVARELENLALCHQIGVLQRSARKRPRLTQWTAFCGSGCPGSGATGARH
jgi:hypothetical protein